MLTVVLALPAPCVAAASTKNAVAIQRAVDQVIRPLMKKNKVAGMAVAITWEGRQVVLNYGVASRESRQPVTDDTIFEIGSVSKTFTATLGSYARETGALSLTDKASKHLPALAGSRLGAVTLLDLATYSAGGLPLQFPDVVSDDASMVAYFEAWRPVFDAGTHRVYSNPSIGLFGHLAARSMGESFQKLMENKLFPALGLAHTFIEVPASQTANYAWGYTKGDRPVRVSAGALDAQAYGVKTTAGDLIHFVNANMGSVPLDATWARAVTQTHTGYYRVGPMTQGLGWEMYAYPTDPRLLLAGNSSGMALDANKQERLDPPRSPRGDVLINKTGSTNGFGAYIAFVPARHIGVVLLANRNYPIADRVKAAHRILQRLAG